MRVNGPYYDKRTDTWYLKEFHHVGRGGSRRLAYPTEQAAKDGLTKIQAILARPEETTVQEALDQWIAERTAFVKNVRRQTRMMADFLAPDLAKPVSRLCDDRAQALYDRLVSLPAQRGDRLVPRSAAYQQSALGHAKEWGRWLVRRKYLRASPFADVAPVGRAKAGPESKVWLDPSHHAPRPDRQERARHQGDCRRSDLPARGNRGGSGGAVARRALRFHRRCDHGLSEEVPSLTRGRTNHDDHPDQQHQQRRDSVRGGSHGRHHRDPARHRLQPRRGPAGQRGDDLRGRRRARRHHQRRVRVGGVASACGVGA